MLSDVGYWHLADMAARPPDVRFQSSFVEHGGLMSYGIDLVEHFGHAAAYVDRILKGEKANGTWQTSQPTRLMSAIGG